MIPLLYQAIISLFSNVIKTKKNQLGNKKRTVERKLGIEFANNHCRRNTDEIFPSIAWYMNDSTDSFS